MLHETILLPTSAKLTTYILENPLEREQIRPAVLVCPGGGYRKVSKREAEPIALAFNAAGYHAFVLTYRIPPPEHDAPTRDAEEAMRLIRENSKIWSLNPEKIAICGFSAGGHITASLCAHGAAETRPNAAILCYSAIMIDDFEPLGAMERLIGENPTSELRKYYSFETQVDSSFPPSFMWHTFDDRSVPVENTLQLADALRKNNVPFELHIYPNGKHGLSLATEHVSEHDDGIIPHVAGWFKLCLEWLRVLFF